MVPAVHVSNVTEVFSATELTGELARAKDNLVVVYFFKPSCHACHALHPKLAQLAQDTVIDGVIFLKVEYQKNEQLCQHLDITQLPFFHFYKGSRGRIAAFSASIATYQRLRGTVDREKRPMCSRTKRRVSTRMAGPASTLTTKERIKMRVSLKKAMDGTSLAMPSLVVARWVERLDNAYSDTNPVTRAYQEFSNENAPSPEV